MKKLDKKEMVLVGISNNFFRLPWYWGKKEKNVWVLRLFSIVASRIKHTDKNFKEHEIHLSELMSYYKNQRGSIEKQLCEKMSSDCNEFLEAGVKEFDPLKKKNKKIPLFETVRFDEKKKTITVKLNKKLKPYFFSLRKNFLVYSFEEFFKLSSPYSQKLYCFLLSWASVKNTTHSLDYVYKVFDDDLKGRHYSEFERSVLKAAQAEIEKKTGLRFSYKGIKEGKKFTQIEFMITAKTDVCVKELPELETKKAEFYKPNIKLIKENAANILIYLDLLRFLPSNDELEVLDLQGLDLEEHNIKGVLYKRICVKNWKEGLDDELIADVEKIFKTTLIRRMNAVELLELDNILEKMGNE